jgi:hypothetical protein
VSMNSASSHDVSMNPLVARLSSDVTIRTPFLG